MTLLLVVFLIIYSFLLYFFFFFLCVVCFYFFFFQAEDGIRDGRVTGVQTCALPIFVGNLGERAVIIETEQNRLAAYEIGYERGRQGVGYALRPRSSRQAARQAFPHGRAHPGILRTSARDCSRGHWPSSRGCALRSEEH